LTFYRNKIEKNLTLKSRFKLNNYIILLKHFINIFFGSKEIHLKDLDFKFTGSPIFEITNKTDSYDIRFLE